MMIIVTSFLSLVVGSSGWKVDVHSHAAQESNSEPVRESKSESCLVCLPAQLCHRMMIINGILRTYFHVRNSHSFPEVQITSRSGNAETESKCTLRLITSLKDRDMSLTCNG